MKNLITLENFYNYLVQILVQKTKRQAKKPWLSRLFPVDLDAPYMNL